MPTSRPPNPRPSGPRLLASVADLGEARVALDLGADILDLKDPARGALGAWPLTTVATAVATLAGPTPLSATIGDLPMEPAPILAAATAMAATGVDIVKIGFFGADLATTAGIARCLAPLTRAGTRIVAVMMADQRPDPALLPILAASGLAGAMLDTADKTSGPLGRHQDERALHTFVHTAKALGLLTGLAGSLRQEDIAPLAALGPDYLGFRGALCHGTRTGTLDPARFRAVRTELDRHAHRAEPLAAAG